MDARTAASTIDQPPSLKRWLASERANGRFYRVLELVAAGALISMLGISYGVLSRGVPTQMASPPLIALLLVGNLIPAILLMVLLTRRLAVRRAEQGGLGTGLLHTRLVALFSIIAAVPTVLVAIFASFLLQSGLEFWFSSRAQTVLNQAQSTAAIYEREHRERLRADMAAMAVDVVRGLNAYGPSSEDFQTVLLQQVAIRQLREAALFTLSDRGEWITYAVVNFDNRPIEQRFTPDEGRKLSAGDVNIKISKADRVDGLIRLDPTEPVFLYGAREINAAAVDALRQTSEAAQSTLR